MKSLFVFHLYEKIVYFSFRSISSCLNSLAFMWFHLPLWTLFPVYIVPCIYLYLYIYIVYIYIYMYIIFIFIYIFHLPLWTLFPIKLSLSLLFSTCIHALMCRFLSLSTHSLSLYIHTHTLSLYTHTHSLSISFL